MKLKSNEQWSDVDEDAQLEMWPDDREREARFWIVVVLFAGIIITSGSIALYLM